MGKSTHHHHHHHQYHLRLAILPVTSISRHRRPGTDGKGALSTARASFCKARLLCQGLRATWPTFGARPSTRPCRLLSNPETRKRHRELAPVQDPPPEEHPGPSLLLFVLAQQIADKPDALPTHGLPALVELLGAGIARHSCSQEQPWLCTTRLSRPGAESSTKLDALGHHLGLARGSFISSAAMPRPKFPRRQVGEAMGVQTF